ncbi:hypothetical protein Pst134EA_019408 [Puccinia striiformis f. sp. tritici]|uniref:hypothetical protein n=1 Tax=Puccinia striiformis f. sp. tritici TaxID=168172 RepID=UPI002008718B|nr:hypothetical protein Pst134EA_019408 [Puccinia striiformis f. sp. tritici]KAH9459254.1 hypothetical protein Pst134EA_019408 [Puccinia striiformis f. sp. tritici]
MISKSDSELPIGCVLQLLAFLALLAALWLRPILQRLPAPVLPKLELKSLNGTQHPNDTCKIIHHPAGSLKYCEDLLHWKEAGVAIASCDQGRPEWNTVLGPLENPDPRGQLFVYDIKGNVPKTTNQHSHDRVYELELTGFPVDKDFHPLGLELHQLSGNTARLFLVNHRRDRSVIEVFKLGYNSPQSSSTDSRRKLSLTWERTLAHPLISTPNAIVALDSNSFLVTNDHFFNRRAHPILHVLETWLTLRGGSVVEVRFADQLPKANMDKTSDSDAGAWENVEAWKTIDGIPFANGLALNPSRTTLVVACSITQKLRYYHQFQPIGSNQRLVFNPIGSRSLSFAPDNIHFDGPQRLIAAGHPHGLTLLKFSRNLEHGVPAGSSVAVVLHSEEPDEPLDPHQAQVHNILVDDGHYFASSTSAIIVPQSDFDDNHQSKQSSSASENKLIVTGLYQTGLLECNLSSV